MVRSLNLITNIVLVWNKVCVKENIKQLHRERLVIDENDHPATRFGFISPAPCAHINRLGKYSFNTDPDLGDNGLRPLRKPKLNTLRPLLRVTNAVFHRPRLRPICKKNLETIPFISLCKEYFFVSKLTYLLGHTA